MSAERAAAADPRRGLLGRPALRQDHARGAALPPRGRRRDSRLDAGRGGRGRRADRRRRRCRSAARTDGGARRRRDAGRPVPARLAGDPPRLRHERDRDRERPAPVPPRRSRARPARARVRRDANRPPPPARRSRRAERSEPRGARQDRPHRRLGLRDREDDRLARARSRGARPRHRLEVRADGPDGDRDRGLGALRRRRHRRLHRRRGGAARRRGQRAWGRPPPRRGPGLDHASRLLGRDARPHPRLRAARVRAVPHGRDDRGRGLRGLPAAVAAEARGAARGDLADAAAGGRRVHRAQHPPPRRRRGARCDRGRPRPRRASSPTTRSGSVPGACSMPCSRASSHSRNATLGTLRCRRAPRTGA